MQLLFTAILSFLLAIDQSYAMKQASRESEMQAALHANILESIPDEILLEILIFSRNNINALMGTCKIWNIFLTDTHEKIFWSSVFSLDFGTCLPENPSIKSSYKEELTSLKKLKTTREKANFALNLGYEALFRSLLSYEELDPNKGYDNDECSMIYKAAQEGYLEIVKDLFYSGANLEITYCGFTPIFIASQKGHLSIVRFLFEAGAKIDARSKEGSSPLYLAAQEGKLDVVNFLIEKKADLEMSFRQEFTPLYVAARNGHDHVVRALLEAGANVDACDSEGANPLYVASQNGHREAVNILLEFNAGPAEYLGGYSPIYVAAQNGHAEILESLIKKFPQIINKISGKGSTPLYVAAQNGFPRCVEILLNAGVLLHTGYTTEGYTPLHVASQKGHKKVVKMLLASKNIQLNIQTNRGATALYVACQHNCLRIVQTLIEHGAGINIPFDNSITPLDRALTEKHEEIVDLLLQHGALSHRQLKETGI